MANACAEKDRLTDSSIVSFVAVYKQRGLSVSIVLACVCVCETLREINEREREGRA